MESRPVALVTGASRNIGRAVALALARDGIDIACVGRDLAMLEETVRAVRQCGVEASLILADAKSTASMEAAVDAVIADYGRLDIVINNAGSLRDGLPQDIDVGMFSDDLQVNLVAQYAVARRAYPHLKASPRPVVVNMGSVAGQVAFPRCVSYVTSKAAIEGLTRALAMDWARDNIRVVCMAPGYVESDISKDILANEASRDWILKRIPLRRVARPQEVGDFVAYLVSPKASFATGEIYYLDGGQRMAI
jgi:NAD(P)-dependent dehydrogenase (short-subunit alcohol dehydrogenase family)